MNCTNRSGRAEVVLPVGRLIGAVTLLGLVALTPCLALGQQPDAPPAQQPAAQADAPQRSWWRAVASVNDFEVEMLVQLQKTADGWTGSLDVPLQGLVGAPLSDIRVSEEALHFVFQPEGAPIGAVFDATRQEDGSFTGTLTQAGQRFPLTITPLTEAEAKELGPKRPQTPKPPFPYRTEDVTITGAGGAVLAGELVVPQGEGPFPAVLFLSGSGGQDRDETLFGHKPFLVLADAFARAGVASLRLDDRGVGGSEQGEGEATVQRRAEDAAAALTWLIDRPETADTKVGILGHSEGAMIAPMVAAKAPEQVAFLVMLAGPGVPMTQLLESQLRAILQASGAPPQQIEAQAAAQRAFFDALLSGKEGEELREAVRQAIIQSVGGVPPQSDAAKAALEMQVDQQLAAWAGEAGQSFLRFDPTPYLKQVRCPVLALAGSLDRQVPAEENIKAIEQALKEAGNDNVQVEILPGLNHLFQPARTGTPDEYSRIETTFDPAAIERIVQWIRTTTGTPAQDGAQGSDHSS